MATGWLCAFASAQTPHAGPDAVVVFPGTATLAGSVTGGTPLSWWTADGNGNIENCLIKYHDHTGVFAVGPLRTASGGTFGQPTDFVRVAGMTYGVDALRRQIYLLATATGLVTPIGSAWSNHYADVESLAYDPAGDRLFAVDRPSGQLLLIDRSTGVPTPVGVATLSGFTEIRSLAWRASNGRLYAVDQATDALLTIDPATGAPTIVAYMAPNPAARIEELEFVGDRLYGVNAFHNGTWLYAAQLQRISPGFGMAQNIGPVIYQVSALCLLVNTLPEDRVWSKVSGPGTVAFSDLYALNPTVTFSQPGTYVLKLSVATSSGTASDTVAIHVLPETSSGSWTAFTPSGDSRIVYVSSSGGNDANNGLSPATAKRTLAEGKRLLRHQFPDWLLLKRGDTWHESLGQWVTSGRSKSEPALVSTYGAATARPLLRTGSVRGLYTTPGAGSPSSLEHVAFVGLHFWADTYAGVGDCPGAELLLTSSDILVEDCKFEHYSTNLIFLGYGGGRQTDFRLRRSVIVDAFEIHNTGNHPEGLYASILDGLLIEGNVFDHNGWNPNVPGAGADIFSHNIYINNDTTNVVVRDNIFSYAGSHGMQLRCGGSVVNNLFVRNSISLVVGAGNDPNPNGVDADVRGNVVLDGKNIGSQPRGWGMHFSNIAWGFIDSNVIAHNLIGQMPLPVIFDVANGAGGNTRGVENTVFSKNTIYDWNGFSQFMGTNAQTINVQLLNNKFQNGNSLQPLIVHYQSSSTWGVFSANNVFDTLAPLGAWMEVGGVNKSLPQWKALVNDTTSISQHLVFPDSSRSILTYQAWIGGVPTLQAFLNEARLQSKAQWRPQYTAGAVNDYIRAGFGVSW